MSRDLLSGSVEEPTRRVYTPSRLNREVRTMLERGLATVWLEGEISNLSRPTSGHWYFSLKDESAQLRSAMFRQRNLGVSFVPKDGMQVLARGRVSLYEPRGDYQFIADHLEEAGEGALRRRFEQLKARLAAEGLFDTARKRQLPKLPRRIGVVTSPTGAAVRDVLNILRRRFPSIPVLIYPVPVQGNGAAEQIAAALRLAYRRAECDVLILARGGGSLEDLWAFNEEVLARAIVESPVPIVSGVGHEVDFTIADFVADVRAPTPSGAAELVAPDAAEWARNIATLASRLSATIQRRLTNRQERLQWLNRRLAQTHPGVVLRQRSQRLDELEQRLKRATQSALSARGHALGRLQAQLRQHSPALALSAARGRVNMAHSRLGNALYRQLDARSTRLRLAVGKLDAFSPLATLQRGYAIVSDEQDRVVTAANDLQPGDFIQARLSAGRVQARVERIQPDDSHDAAD